MKKNEITRVIAGAGGGKGSSSSSSRTPVEAADTLRSRTMVSILDLLGEGQIGGLIKGGESIFIDEVPLLNPDQTLNFSGVTWQFRDGSQSQSVIEGFSDIHTPKAVSVKVGFYTPRTVSIDSDDADQVQVIVKFPKLVSVDKTTGDSHGATVRMQFSIASETGNFVPVTPCNEKLPSNNRTAAVSLEGNIIVLRGKKNGAYYRSFTFALPKPGKNYRLRMERLTNDSRTDYLADETWFDSFSEIKLTKLNYPNSSLVGLKFDSEHFGSGSVPSRAYLVSGMRIRVPANYNPASNTYIGDWDGSWQLHTSCNPAWILFDLLTNKRYGLGQYISASAINLAMLYQIGRYCDQEVDDGFGGKERRFAVNTVISRRGEAYRVINDLASAFRSMIFWAGGMIGLSQDSPGEPVALVSHANIIGDFEYKGSARKDRSTVALVTYNDKTDNYKQNIEYVEDPEGIARYGVRQTEVVAFGCTSRGQAYRLGLWLLYTSRMESELISFTTGPDMTLLLPGDLIKIQDRYRSGRRASGRVLGMTANSVRLDAETEIKPGSFITLMTADGKLVDRDILDNGNLDVVTFASPLNPKEMPADLGLWVITSPDLTPVLGRVISIAQGNDAGTFDITCVHHNPSKFSAVDNGAILLPVSNTVLDPTYSTPENLIVDEGTYWESPGNLGIRLMLSWEGRSPSYIVVWRRTDIAGEWERAEVRDEQFDILGVAESGAYDIRVVGVSVTGKQSEPLDGKYLVKGTMTPPEAPSQLTAFGDYRNIVLNWANPDSVDLDHIQVWGGKTNDLEAAGLLAKVASTNWTHAGLGDNETWYYWVRAANKRQMLGPPNSNLGTSATTRDVLSFLKDQITRSELGEELLKEIDSKATTEKVDEVREELEKTIEELFNRGETIAADVDTVRDELAQAQSELEQQVQSVSDRLTEEMADAQAKIINVGQIAQDANQLAASALNAVAVAKDEFNAAIAQEREARISDDEALARDISLVQAGVNDNLASIKGVQQAVSDLNSAQVNVSTSLEATARANIENALGDFEGEVRQRKTNASIKTTQKVMADDQEAMAQRIEEMKAQLDDDIIAAITEESLVRVREDEALARQILALETQVNDDIRAAIREESLARATEDEALARQITSLQAQVSVDITAAIANESSVRAREDEALASSITALRVQMGKDISAAIATESTARAKEDESLARQITTLSAKTTADIAAAVSTETTARTTADNALAGQITALTAKVASDISAAVSSEATARANADSALGGRIDTVTAQVGANSAAIQETRTAVAGVDGKVSASWTMKVETSSNGVKYAAGLALGVDQDGTSQFLVSANRFGLVNNAGGQITTPFVVDNGVAYMEGAYIRNGSIDNAKIGNYIQSNNYVAGSAGWSINKNGSAELNNVTVRGAVFASAGTFDNVTINNNCNVLGTLDATQIRGLPSLKVSGQGSDWSLVFSNASIEGNGRTATLYTETLASSEGRFDMCAAVFMEVKYTVEECRDEFIQYTIYLNGVAVASGLSTPSALIPYGRYGGTISVQCRLKGYWNQGDPDILSSARGSMWTRRRGVMSCLYN